MSNILLLAVLLSPGQDALGSGEASTPAQAGKAKSHAEVRKEARDKVLQSVGPQALAFTKRFGDLGIATLQQVEPETGKNLVRLFDSGELAKLKHPRAALEAVRRNGNAAGVWMVEHLEQLADSEALECWCRETMDYVYDLKDIEQQAAALRESRRILPLWIGAMMAGWNVSYIVLGVLAALLLGVTLWKRRPARAP